jgi:hypothetical protein
VIFKHIETEFKTNWERVVVDNKRFYTISGSDNSILLPSISTVLSDGSDNSWLEEWKQRVGEEEAERVSRISKQTGTQLHKLTENYLNNIKETTTDDEVKFFTPMVLARFQLFKPLLNRISNIRCQERMMGSIKIGIAGTVDCIADWDGVPSIIDFKTSKRKKKIEDIQSYLAQATAYAIMFYECTGIRISQIVIIMSVENDDNLVFVSNIRKHYEYLKEVKQNYDSKRIENEVKRDLG